MDAKKVCLELLRAESELAVQNIIDGTPEFSSAKNWRPLDGRETNFNVTSNQASDGGKALTELMTNMVDAVLMKHAYSSKIDPRSSQAPQTMYEAVAKFFKWIPSGKLVNVDPDDPQLRDFAGKNLLIGITGAKNRREGLPCYTFVDSGEGQHAADFPKTFLSLSEGNKKSIPFVQGKYNMGSSGVLGYCGRKWFKLIVSRRYDQSGGWGWTLLRRRPGQGMPVAEYFVLPNGSIPEFSSASMYPFQTSTGATYEGMALESGTVIKLFDYQVGAKFLSFRGAREALNENLVETILPFRLLDFRQKPDKKRTGDRALGIDPRPFYGMEFLLLNSHNEGSETAEDVEDAEDDSGEASAEKRLSVGEVHHPELGKVSVTAIALKRKIPAWLRNTNNRVFHTVNGQVQFKQTRGYLTDCGYPALKDRVVIIADASELSYEAQNEVWKGDREHIRNTVVGEIYREQITLLLKESDPLKKLQLEVARQELDRAKREEGNDLFQKLVDADRNLANLLTSTDPVITVPTGGGQNGDTTGKSAFEGKYSPTFLKIDEKLRGTVVEIPVDRSRAIPARTDAENNYFSRAENRGQLIVPEQVSTKFAVRPQLSDGRLNIFLSPIRDAVLPGTEMVLQFALQDPAMPEPLIDEIKVRVADEAGAVDKKKVKTPNQGRGGSGGERNGDGQRRHTHGLPKFRLLTKDGRETGGEETVQWPEGFTETDGGYVSDLGDQGFLYYINYDNAYHIKYKQQARGDVAKQAITEKYILGMRILMLGFEHAITTRQANEDGAREFFDEFRRMCARAAASVVLALAENLPKLVDAGADVE